MTNTAKDIIGALIYNASVQLDFPDHKNKEGKVDPDNIVANFDMVESGYLQFQGKIYSKDELTSLVNQAIYHRNGSILIDILKESGKIKDFPPAFMEKLYITAFEQAGFSLYPVSNRKEIDGKLFDVPEKYRTGVGYPSDKEVVALCHFYLKGIKGYEDPESKKTYRNKLFNLLHVYAHLQESVLTESLGVEWVANFKEGNKTFEDFKQAIDMATQGESLKYTREEQPYIYFQGRVHLNGPVAIHSPNDPDEEIKFLTNIMENTEDQESVVFTKAIAFIHRSAFQQEIYHFLTSLYDENEQYWLADNRQRADFVFNLVGRYMEECRAKTKIATTRYSEQPRDPQPTQGKEQMFNSNLTQAIQFLAHARGVSVETLVGELKQKLGNKQVTEQPKVQISGPDGEMLDQLKQIFGDDCVIVPISQGDDISEAIAKAVGNKGPSKEQELKEGIDWLTSRWADILGVTDPEAIEHLRAAATKSVQPKNEVKRPITTEVRHARTMEFEVLGEHNEVEERYRGLWNEATKLLTISYKAIGMSSCEQIACIEFKDYSDAVSTFIGMCHNYSIKPVHEIIKDFVEAYNGRIL